MWQNINLVLIISGSRKHLITEGRVSIVNSIWDYKLSELRLKTRCSCCRLCSPIYKCSVGNPGALWCKSCNECFHLMRIGEKSLNTASMTRQASDWWILKSVPDLLSLCLQCEACDRCSHVMYLPQCTRDAKPRASGMYFKTNLPKLILARLPPLTNRPRKEHIVLLPRIIKYPTN